MGEVEWTGSRNGEQGYVKGTYLISRLNGEKNEEEKVATSSEGSCEILPLDFNLNMSQNGFLSFYLLHSLTYSFCRAPDPAHDTAICYGLKCTLPESYFETLTFNVIVFGGQAFGKLIRFI